MQGRSRRDAQGPGRRRPRAARRAESSPAAAPKFDSHLPDASPSQMQDRRQARRCATAAAAKTADRRGGSRHRGRHAIAAALTMKYEQAARRTAGCRSSRASRPTNPVNGPSASRVQCIDAAIAGEAAGHLGGGDDQRRHEADERRQPQSGRDAGPAAAAVAIQRMRSVIATAIGTRSQKLRGSRRSRARAPARCSGTRRPERRRSRAAPGWSMAA